jgi:hypothetical protein
MSPTQEYPASFMPWPLGGEAAATLIFRSVRLDWVHLAVHNRHYWHGAPFRRLVAPERGPHSFEGGLDQEIKRNAPYDGAPPGPAGDWRASWAGPRRGRAGQQSPPRLHRISSWLSPTPKRSRCVSPALWLCWTGRTGRPADWMVNDSPTIKRLMSWPDQSGASRLPPDRPAPYWRPPTPPSLAVHWPGIAPNPPASLRIASHHGRIRPRYPP